MTTTCWTQRTQLSLAFGPPDAKRLLNWMPVAIAVTVFLVDFFTPRGLAASALYARIPGINWSGRASALGRGRAAYRCCGFRRYTVVGGYSATGNIEVTLPWHARSSARIPMR